LGIVRKLAVTSLAGALLGIPAVGDSGAFPALQYGCIPGFLCAPNKSYQPVSRAPDGSFKNGMNKKEDAVRAVTMYVGGNGWHAYHPERDKIGKRARKIEFFKGYIEYAESGEAFDDNQRLAILDKLERLKSSNRPVYVVAYIHGWHHNADTSVVSREDAVGYDAIKIDYFVARYAEQARRLFELNKVDNTPVVLAVFVGWRGDSATGPLSKFSSLGDRAQAADRMAAQRGPKSLYFALQSIADKIRESGSENRMLAVGHSLGGRALSTMFLPEIAKGQIQPLGANVLIAALQPAIGADCYDQIFKNGPIKGSSGMMPSFVAITSKDDAALYKFYPLARSLLIPPPPAACDENSEGKDVTIGLYKDYLTHRIDFESHDRIDLTKADVQSPLLNVDKAFRYPLVENERGWLYKEGNTTWRYPFFDVKDEYCRKNPNYYCYRVQNSSIYFLMSLERQKAFPRTGAVWNIRTDKNLVDVSSGATHSREGSIDAKHNGIASTGLADILSRIVYSQKDWVIQVAPDAAVALPAPAAPVVPVPSPP
jgi:hypothetical protein